MIKIAICDDENVFCSQLEDIILSYFKNSSEGAVVEIFNTGEKLCQFIRIEHSFDLIFLDIEMEGINGVEVGRAIREDMNDSVTQILYISSNQRYSMQLFENRPLNFLIKPVSEEKIISSLEKAMDLLYKGNLFFEFYVGKAFRRIAYKDIIFFQSRDKKIKIVTMECCYECYGKLQDIANSIPNQDFIAIHKSYLVNFFYVSEANYDNLLLTNNEHLSISQSHRKGVRDALIKRRRDRK